MSLPDSIQRDLDRMVVATSKKDRVDVWPAGHNAMEVASKISNVIDPKADVLLWASNSRSPMDDMLAAWLFLGVISEAQAITTHAASDAQTAAFLAEYRAAQPAEPSAEERYEMLAAFGPGATVVDVISGRTVTL